MTLVLQISLSALVVIVFFTGLFLYRARRESEKAYSRIAAYGKDFLNKHYGLKTCRVKPEYQTLKPWKVFGLFKCVCNTAQGNKYRWVNMSDSTIALFMKMHTLLFVPDCRYNLPMMSIDIIFMGKKRVFVIEIIDPAGIADENIKKHYDRMRGLKPQPVLLHDAPVTRWYKDIVTDFSIHSRLDRSADGLIFDTYKKYMDAYAAMVAEAQPVSAEISRTLKEKQEWYAETLISQGGPAVDLLAKMMGSEKQREYTWTVMFGFDTEK